MLCLLLKQLPLRLRQTQIGRYKLPGGNGSAGARFPQRQQPNRRGPLKAQAVICCDRLAYVGIENEELRITFDRSIRWRDDELSLTFGDSGRELLQNGEVLMEIKMPGSAPLWLADMLSRHGIFPTGFSKYGTCYTKNLIDKTFTGVVKSC